MRALVLLVLIAAPCLAGWQPLGVIGGTTEDLVVTDAGGVVASSSGLLGEAAWFASDGTLHAQMSGSFVGAGASAPSCLVGLRGDQQILFSAPGCGTNNALSGSSVPKRYRVASNGSAFAVVQTTQDNFFWGSSPAVLTQVGSSWSGREPRALGVTTVGADEFAVFNTLDFGIVWVLNGTAPRNTRVGYVSYDLVPFALNGAPAALSSLLDGGLRIARDVRDAGAGFDPSTVPSGQVVLNVAFTNEGDRGYGIATTASGAVLSPIPDPSRIGQVWVRRVPAPLLTGRVHCNGALWCAGYSLGGVVHLLTNAAPPTLSVAPVTINPGTSQVLVADAGDPDGDPVFVSWSSTGVGVTALDPSGTQVSLTSTTAVCGSPTVTVSATAWDGRQGHETTSSIVLPVHQGFVSVSPAGVTVDAGSGPLTFTALVDGGCPLAVMGWSTGASGATTSWTPPRNVCAPTTIPITVNANGQVASSTVLVQPWGPGETPVFPAGAKQDAGTTVVWRPTNQLHVCEGTGGFPGVALLWEVDAGMTGATAIPVDGGLRVTTSASCVDGTLVASARSSINGVSPPGVLTVALPGDIAPLGATTPFGIQLGSVAGAGTASGTFALSATCLAQRSLSTDVRLLSVDGGMFFSSMQGTATWSVPVPASCDPRYTVTAELLEGANRTGAKAQVAVIGPSSAQPITSTTPFTLSAAVGVDGGVVAGKFDLQTNCLNERALRATVELLSPDGGARADGGFAVPGAWELSFQPGCDPRLIVRGVLYEDGGATGASEQVSLTGPSIAVPITPATPFTISLSHDAGVASGKLALGVNCLAERAAAANIVIRQLDGGVVADGGFAVPGPWALTVPPACDPRLIARADVFENGAPANRFEEVSFTGLSSATPITAATPFTMNLAFDATAARASGRFDVGATCLAERALSATVTISRVGGGVVSAASFSVPGEWALEVPDGCNGGDFTVRAELLARGLPAGPVDTGAFSARQLPLAAGALTPSEVEVSCGVGAHATLTLPSLPDSCAAGTLTWTRVAGPEYEAVRQEGRSLELQSLVTDLSLVGQVLQLEISVDAGIGNQAAFQREVRLTAAPFVTLTPRLKPLLPTSEEAIDAALIVTNTASCAVDALEVVVASRDLSMVEGSLTVDGVPTTGTVDGDELAIAPLILEGHQSALVRFKAHARLLGVPSLTATASVRGVPVSILAASKDTTGCGCDAGGGTLFILGLVMLTLGGRNSRSRVRGRRHVLE